MEEPLCFRFLIFTFSLHCFMAFLALSSRTNFTTDQHALLAFKYSITSDPYNFLTHNWSTSTSICSWVGITCNYLHGRVSTLNLSNMGLRGTIPSHLGNLSFLIKLDLGGNNFHDELPRDLVHLRRLKLLNLSYNEFSGNVPSWIGGLSSLRFLRLTNNSFGGLIPKSISNLTMLESLRWNDNLIYGNVPPEIGRLSHLRVLEIANNNLSGTIPPMISNISSLEKISLSYNSLSGEIPREIGELPKLRIMYLGNNPLTGSIPSTVFNNSMLQEIHLGSSNFTGTLPSNICHGLPKLQVLYIAFSQLSGKIPSLWHQCKELTDLDLSKNRFSRGSIPHDIGNLTMLASLYLNEDNLEGEIPSSLFNISSMRELSLQINKFYGSLTEEMFHQLPSLEIFSLAQNQFVGSIPNSISNCTLLQELYLSYNSFTGSIPEGIGGLPVTILSLGGNNLSGSIPSNIFNMSSLNYFFLANNSLSGFLPLHISLENLEELELYSNGLGGKIPDSISNASKLNYVSMEQNNFNGVIPNALGNLRYLQWLGVAYNNLTTEASTIEVSFLTSLQYLDISGNPLHGKIPSSIGNMSNSLKQFYADSCNINGKIPMEIGNLSNLFTLSLSNNDLSGQIPTTTKGLQSLQYLNLGNNQLQGTIIDELCETKMLSELYITENMLSGMMPACFDNLTFLRKLNLGFNKLNELPSSLWSLQNILEVNLSHNTLTGFLPLAIGNLKALISLDLSKNQISGTIPRVISGLLNLQTLTLAHNKLQGNIPDSFGNLIGLEFLDLSRNYLFGVIPKSLESLHYLKFINLSYNRLEGEIPNGGAFKNLTAQSFMFNKALCGNARLQVPPCSEMTRQRSNPNLFFIKCILPVMVSIILIVLCVFLLIRHRRKNGVDPTEGDLSLSTLPATKMIPYYELFQATDGFDESNLLGNGSFGSVFKGTLSNGMVVAVKMFNLDLEIGSKSFSAECEAMRNLRHRNLIKIIGSCSNFDYKILVMEFMVNGSLERCLYSHNYCLDFLQRLNIMIDVASALDYMHHHSSPAVVHCDVKPSNVLLDEDMVAHVSDFGIAKLLDEGQSKAYTKTMATLGYIAPEFGSKGIISTKGDVYSFGIMLMETFTRKKPTDDLFVAGLSMKSWISESLPHAITRVVDSNLLQEGGGDQIDDTIASVSSILRLALNCCADLHEERMNMTDVAASLNKTKTMFQQINGKHMQPKFI